MSGKEKLTDIKLIVTDMDGTFLKEDDSFNKERFRQQLLKMRKRGIRFAVASGRQYYGIAPLFQELEQDIIFITDNGSCIRHRN